MGECERVQNWRAWRVLALALPVRATSRAGGPDVSLARSYPGTEKSAGKGAENDACASSFASSPRCSPTQMAAPTIQHAQPIDNRRQAPLAPVPASMAERELAASYKKFPQMVPAADVNAASVEARFRAGKTVPLAEALGYAAQLPSEQRANDISTGCYCLKFGGACGCLPPARLGARSPAHNLLLRDELVAGRR